MCNDCKWLSLKCTITEVTFYSAIKRISPSTKTLVLLCMQTSVPRVTVSLHILKPFLFFCNRKTSTDHSLSVHSQWKIETDSGLWRKQIMQTHPGTFGPSIGIKHAHSISKPVCFEAWLISTSLLSYENRTSLLLNASLLTFYLQETFALKVQGWPNITF